MRRAEFLRSPSTRRWQALWVALYALGFLLSTAHFSFVAHRVCEHGEVAHVEVGELAHCESDALAAPRAAQAEALRSVSEPGLPADHSPAPLEDEGHEHCELDPATQAAPSFELAPLGFAQWLEECFGPRVEPAPRAPAIAILRLAPGRSPPLA